MKVSKKSWHYWLNSIFNENLISARKYSRITLCDYFWGTVESVLISLLCLVLVCAIAAVFLTGFALITMVLAFPSTAITGICFSWVDVSFCMTILGIIGFFSLIGGLVSYLTGDMDFFPEYMKKPFRKTKGATTLKETKPSLVVEMYKAHKSKWCPLIEIEIED